jgi:hypothetical protein
VDNKFSFSHAENRRDKQNFNLADALQDKSGFFLDMSKWPYFLGA